jgi:hypothetical protein
MDLDHLVDVLKVEELNTALHELNPPSTQGTALGLFRFRESRPPYLMNRWTSENAALFAPYRLYLHIR